MFGKNHPGIKWSRHLILKGLKREVGKIWSQITLIHEKIESFEEPREADLNNSQPINTMQQ